MKYDVSKSEKAGENPPVLTGGLKPENNPINISYDWLTVTVNKKGSQILCRQTVFVEDGYPGNGFAKTELRKCLGGFCWRKMEPKQDELKFGFGKDYESWEFSGCTADSSISELTKVECKPTRIDIAFDYRVENDYLSDHWIESVRSHVESKGIKIGISGQGRVNTRYIGSPQSERRIRIYRKDYRDIEVRTVFGPVLRIELVLKGEQAISFWNGCVHSDKNFYKLAAAHIYDMTGFMPIPDQLSEIPKIKRKAPSSLVQKLHQFLKQYGNIVKAYQIAGLNLDLLIDCKHTQSLKNKVARHRYQRLTMELNETDVRSLESIVYAAIEEGL